MKDEDQTLPPDEHQVAPAQAGEDVAELEREARAKREAAMLNEHDDDEKDPVQPAVNKLKKRKRGKMTAFLALVAVALIFLTWGGNWVYRNFLAQPKEEKQEEPAPQTSQTDYRKRNDLGMATDTGQQEQPQQDNSQGSTEGNNTVGTGQAAPLQLDKARFLVRRDGEASSQGQVKTRQQEMTQLSGATSTDATAPAQAQGQGQGQGQGQQQDAAAATTGQSPAVVRRIPLNPDLYIPENRSIPCSLDYRFVSDRAGKLRCTITTDIWSASGNTKLIEKGTTATGIYRTGGEDGMKHGQGRAFVIITKLRTKQKPYLDIPMVDTSAAGALGEAGMDGWVDNHFSDRFAGALLVGMIPDVAAWASNSAGQKDRNTDYTENSRQAMADMARTTLENSINIPPTLYKNQGEIINLITGQDIDFSNIYTLRMKE
ncbi:type VI secretion protein [Cronobacter sakazakii]|nr:type VI secretion protein [Cronobacter sakazakii]EMD7601832.1 type VI secretion protein [Cronobacter sakazakii]